MKKRKALFMLFNKLMLKKLIVLLLIMLVLNAGVMAICGGFSPDSFTNVTASVLPIIFYITGSLFILFEFGELSKKLHDSYFRRTIDISMTEQFFIRWIASSLHALVLFLSEIAVLYLIPKLYSLIGLSKTGPTDMYVAFRRNAFLFNLLPLGNAPYMIRNILIVLLFGAVWAYISIDSGSIGISVILRILCIAIMSIGMSFAYPSVNVLMIVCSAFALTMVIIMGIIRTERLTGGEDV